MNSYDILEVLSRSVKDSLFSEEMVLVLEAGVCCKLSRASWIGPYEWRQMTCTAIVELDFDSQCL